MINRRSFIKIGGAAAAFGSISALGCDEKTLGPLAIKKPVVISTWNHGLPANARAWEILSNGGKAIDAVEAGVRVTEEDPTVSSVGIGGSPDRSGVVTLDACIMNEHGDCGSVACLKDIVHPISVARKVMEETPHVMLVGEGARQFAIEKGFEPTELLTPEAKARWEAWKAGNPGEMEKAVINVENHDTIGMVALDENGDLSGACTTSGAAWKLPGRVGDSPIIGAGLYVDNEVGGAAATGWGEAVIRAVGCFLVVEFMRQGNDPETACKLAVDRVISKNPDWKEIQVGFIALNKAGDTGSYCIQSGFDYAVYSNLKGNQLIDSKYRIEASASE